MKILIEVLLVTLSFNLFGQQGFPKLYVNTRVAKFDSKGEMKKHDSLWVLKEQYFEISLNLLLTNKYGADKNEMVTQSKIIAISIVDNKGQPIDYNSPTDFLNWMYSHGYEMQDQAKSQYRIDYTFRKRK